jgi:hypothetical protein
MRREKYSFRNEIICAAVLICTTAVHAKQEFSYLKQNQGKWVIIRLHSLMFNSLFGWWILEWL